MSDHLSAIFEQKGYVSVITIANRSFISCFVFFNDFRDITWSGKPIITSKIDEQPTLLF